MIVRLVFGALACVSVLAAMPLSIGSILQTLSDRQEAFPNWNGETFVSEQTFGQPTDGWIETLSWEPRAYLYHDFITDEEADHIIQLAKPYLQKSEVVNSATGEFMQSKERTSSGHFLQRRQDSVVARVEERLSQWTRLPVENGEPLHVLLYQPGEQYTEHFDYFFDEPNQQNGGQRVATALIYLSTVEQGGETVFPDSKYKPTAEEAKQYSVCGQAGLAVKPKKGDCLLFWSLKPDSKTKDRKSLHAGCPVIKGTKYSATKWIRVREHTVY